MELKIITKPDELRAIQEDWSALCERSSNKGVYQCYEWCWASYEIFHPNDQLYVLILTDDFGHLSGIAPLVITSGTYRGIKVRKIGFVKNDQNPANDFILSEGLEEICLKIFMDHLVKFSKWEFIELQKVRVEGLTCACLQKLLLKNGNTFGTKENIQSPYILIDKNWNDFWKAKSKRFRKAMQNKINRVKNLKNLVIDKITVTSAITPELEDVLKISAKSWKHDIGNDLLTRESNWNFYKDICDLLGPRGLICIWFLRLDTAPVAFEFHIQYEGVVYPIRADYDKAYKDISPGSILEYEIIKSLFTDKNASEYNSCGHTYDYLMNWTDITRKHHNFEIFGKNIKMSVLYNFEYKLLDFFRETRLYSLIRKLKTTH
jgi:hypothetical protein